MSTIYFGNPHYMKLLIKQATIADPSSPFNGLTQDIFIIDGVIDSISPIIEQEADKIIEAENLHISQGWVDIFCQFNDPGAEHKETLESGANAAVAGGYTDVFVVPNTSPCLHSKSQIEYVVQKSASLPAAVHPIGDITKNCEGRELAEMYDMKSSGAIAFTDGWNPLQSGQVMLKALQYVKAFDGVIIQVPDEVSLSKNGLMNEGIISTQLGLPGKPAIAESLMIARDIELLRYTQSRLHITGISTAAGIELIRKAKAERLQITCSVTPYHLSFTDEDLAGYNTNLKVNPALRTKADMEALKTAVLDGTVDCISSHHYPQNYDGKICEFEYAKYGMEGLESSAGAVMQALPQITAHQLADLFTGNARKIFGLKTNAIDAKNKAAAITLFTTETENIFTKKQVQSLCTNNAFIGKTMGGKVIGTIRGKRLFLNS